MAATEDKRWIETFTGKRFCPLDPDPIMIGIEDIAHGLAGRFRFSGQSRDWYTVAQHSYQVSRDVPSEDAIWGLLHDAAEAYLPDIARPIKNKFYVSVDDRWGSHRIPGRVHEIILPFDEVEHRVLEAVAVRFGLRLPIPLSVLQADDRELARERRDLFDDSTPWGGLPSPVGPTLRALSPKETEALFLARFEELRR